MMRTTLFFAVVVMLFIKGNGFLNSKTGRLVNTTDTLILAEVKIYSNLAEIIKPLGKLPLEFSAEDWSHIRSDSVTLVGSNVTITQQTITEKKKSLKNAEVYVRSPSSSNTQTKFIKATLVDETRNLVKMIDKDISKDPIYFTASPNDIVYDDDPPQSKYYVNFIYDTSDAVFVSYLRSNLNWKTRYQLNLFEDAKTPILIAMADIRNDGQSKVEIEHAELLGGDINLQLASQRHSYHNYHAPETARMADASHDASVHADPPTLSRGEEVAGLYVFAINQPFSIDAKTNHLLPMFRPHVTVDRFSSISKSFGGSVASSSGKASRSYRIVSDRFLSGGNCIIRESDRLVGETLMPDLAAKDKHTFSIGEDADITYKENVTLVSTRTYNETVRLGNRDIQQRTQSIYGISVSVKNFKSNRGVKVEYQQQFYAQSVKLETPNRMFTQDGSIVKSTMTIAANSEKLLSYNIETIN